MKTLMSRMAGLLVVGVIGLSMTFYCLERLSLIHLATSLGQDDGRAPLSVQISLFAGLALVYLAGFWAIIFWSRYVRSNPGVSQAPVWLLLTVLTLGLAGMLWGLATHSAWLNTQATVPMDVAWGYVAYQVVAGTLIMTPIVLVGVRWAPGYKHKEIAA